jgi:pilus assembly protein CpaF
MYKQYDLKTWSSVIQDYCVDEEIPIPRWPDVQDILANHNEAKLPIGTTSAPSTEFILSGGEGLRTGPPRLAQKEEVDAFLARILRGMREKGFQVDEKDRQGVGLEIARRIIRLGVLDRFLDEEGVEEIIVRNGFVQTERWGQIRNEGPLQSDGYFHQLARKIADIQGKGLGRAEPQIKLGLPDGSRFTATIPPLSQEGTAINIRRFAKKKMTFDNLLEAGSVDEETVDFLIQVARSMSVSVVFSGKPGAGKTTWLNAFSQYLPKEAQVSCVETFRELDLQVEHPQRLIVEEDPEVMGQAINTIILRMRPDVLMIGEVVSREAMQYIIALNLGIVTHTTTHAKSATFALTRLETLSRESDITLEQRRSIIGEGLLVVHLTKGWDEKAKKYDRFMSELLAVTGVTRVGERLDYELKTLKRQDGKGGFTPLKGGMEIWHRS